MTYLQLAENPFYPLSQRHKCAYALLRAVRFLCCQSLTPATSRPSEKERVTHKQRLRVWRTWIAAGEEPGHGVIELLPLFSQPGLAIACCALTFTHPVARTDIPFISAVVNVSAARPFCAWSRARIYLAPFVWKSPSPRTHRPRDVLSGLPPAFPARRKSLRLLKPEGKPGNEEIVAEFFRCLRTLWHLTAEFELTPWLTNFTRTYRCFSSFSVKNILSGAAPRPPV